MTDGSTPVGSYGAIGDLNTIGLIGSDGSFDWLCWPRFDSPSIFGHLLDPDGGSWRIESVTDARRRHLYLPDTNVLITRLHLDEGLVELHDFMLTGENSAVVRELRGVRGEVAMRSVLQLKPDYGRSDASWTPRQDGYETDIDESVILALGTEEMELEDGNLLCNFVVREGERIRFSLGDQIDISDESHCDVTADFWREWIGQSSYDGRWQEVVRRSALTLKLLTHSESGGVIAAGTTSLPEAIGGERNWDYRYVWIRDAAFTLYAFLELGFTAEANAFTDWLIRRLNEGVQSDRGSGPLSPLYDLDGNFALDEVELDHWSGYRNSAPVRVGNAASEQLQLDIYGELIDSLYLADKQSPLSLDDWTCLTAVVDWVCDNWDQPDDGMWEVRSGRQRFTSSALMCWVALERAIRMSTFRGRPADLDRWRSCRDAIHRSITENAWSDDVGAFTQTYGGTAVDASILLMPLVKFISPTDPKWLSTLAVVEEQLTHDVLVDRYRNSEADDGLEGEDGSFSICSFWFVENLARSGRVDDARLLFDKMLSYAGPLGLFSEVISPAGEQLGNYPQAFTHLSLISAAVHLDHIMDQP